MTRQRIITAIAAFLFAACDHADAPLEYEDMDLGQRFEFMKDVVLPEMTATFREFDAKYTNMTCATCHGPGTADGSFAMPNPQLPVLPSEADFPAYAMQPEHAAMTQFMIESVWPQMADLLGRPPYSEDNPAGFSCSDCHTVAGGVM